MLEDRELTVEIVEADELVGPTEYALITRTERLRTVACDLVRHFVGRGFAGEAMFRHRQGDGGADVLQPEPVRSAVSNLDLQRLQQWAMDARYPADLPDITAGDAAAVVAIADQIVAAVALAAGADGLA